MPVTYEHIHAEPFGFLSVSDVQIYQEPNSHPTALVCGLIEPARADEYLIMAVPDILVRIFETSTGEERTLFYGVIAEISTSWDSGNCTLNILLDGASIALDLQKGNQSFQNFNKTYAEIMDEVVGGDGLIQTHFEDKKLPGLEVRYRETKWEFLKKLSAKIGVCLLPECTGKRPQIYIGLPDIPVGRELAPVSYARGMRLEEYRKAEENGLSPSPEDFAYADFVSHDFELLGRRLTFNKRPFWIKSAYSYFENGYLTTRYRLAPKGAFENAAIPEIFAAEEATGAARLRNRKNLRLMAAYSRVRDAADGGKQREKEQKRIEGRMFYGTVVAVKKDKVRVHITDMDKDADAASTQWFPYATPYAPSDGSGWYVMPEIGDTVRVYFPSADPAKAFACSALGKTAKSDPADKSWSTPSGKEILMNKDGVYLINKQGAMMIEMTEEGVSIISDGEMRIEATELVDISSESQVKIEGKDGVILIGGVTDGTGKSSVALSDTRIQMTADEVYHN
jgi:phage baseplate assembly protein gpV